MKAEAGHEHSQLIRIQLIETNCCPEIVITV